MMKRKPYDQLTETQKQRINQQLVSKEVERCVSSLVTYIFEKSIEDGDAPFSEDDIENKYLLNHDRLRDEIEEQFADYETRTDDVKKFIDKQKEDIELFLKEAGKETIEQLDNDELEELVKEIMIDLGDFEEEQEIYEWYYVSDFLLSRLSDRGEPVIETEGLWGRTTTGQGIVIDGVTYQIAKELWDEGYYFNDDDLTPDYYEQVSE